MFGRFEEARSELAVALQLDPLSSTLRCDQAYLYMLDRKYDETVRIYQHVAEAAPSFYQPFATLGRAYLQIRAHAEAVGVLEKARSLAGDILSVPALP